MTRHSIIMGLWLLLLPVLGHARDVAGTWITCNPRAPWAFSLLSVEKDGDGYRWVMEWGTTYTAGGTASLLKREVVLRGCKAYRGDVESGCDRGNPPEYLRLKAENYRRFRGDFTNDDLRTGRLVRLSKENFWEKMANRCRELAKASR